MANCCFCGKIVNVMYGVTPLSADHQSYILCSTCATARKNIENLAPTAKENVRYLSSFLPKITDPIVRESLSALLIDPDARHVEEARKQREEKINAIIMTSGFNFEGWKILDYLGFISTEVAMGMGYFKAIAASFSDMLGIESSGLRNKLADAKTLVLNRLRIDAYERGANAIIGIDIDYTMFGDSIVGVIASGTAVRVEKV